MPTSDRLKKAAEQIDVLDAAGGIIANADRLAPAAAAAVVLALARATERFWEVCIEADLLTRAIAIPITGNDIQDRTRDAAVQHQAGEVARLLAAIRAESETLNSQQEMEHGSSHS